MYPQPFHLAASLSCHWDQPALPRLPFHEQVKSVSMRSCVAYHYSALIAYWGGRAEGVVLYMCLLSGCRQQLYNIPPEAINPAHWTFASSSKKQPPRLTSYFKTLIIPEYVLLNLTHTHIYIFAWYKHDYISLLFFISIVQRYCICFVIDCTYSMTSISLMRRTCKWRGTRCTAEKWIVHLDAGIMLRIF